MAKKFHPGLATTQIILRHKDETRGDTGYYVYPDGYAPLYGGAPVWCQWVNAHGREVYEARQAQVTEPATLTLPYSPDITVDILIERVGASGAKYEIIGLDDVDNRHAVLELKVIRREGAR